ncbi:MAG: hypothetical protein KDC92_17030 [Bacteroidetes bacterium]|nr:hypothetical protein [Bacteroidota bacterium]
MMKSSRNIFGLFLVLVCSCNNKPQTIIEKTSCPKPYYNWVFIGSDSVYREVYADSNSLFVFDDKSISAYVFDINQSDLNGFLSTMEGIPKDSFASQVKGFSNSVFKTDDGNVYQLPKTEFNFSSDDFFNMTIFGNVARARFDVYNYKGEVRIDPFKDK